jgi:hypothetical protein
MMACTSQADGEPAGSVRADSDRLPLAVAKTIQPYGSSAHPHHHRDDACQWPAESEPWVCTSVGTRTWPGPCAPWRAAQCASGLPPELWGAWTARPGEAPPRGKWSFKPAVHTATIHDSDSTEGLVANFKFKLKMAEANKPRWATVRRGFRVLPDFRDSYCHSIYLRLTYYLVNRKSL